jgi:hypothetical protein
MHLKNYISKHNMKKILVSHVLVGGMPVVGVPAQFT